MRLLATCKNGNYLTANVTDIYSDGYTKSAALKDKCKSIQFQEEDSVLTETDKQGRLYVSQVTVMHREQKEHLPQHCH